MVDKNIIIQIGVPGMMSCFLNMESADAIKLYCKINEISLIEFCDEVSYIEFDNYFKAYYLDDEIKFDQTELKLLLDSLIAEESEAVDQYTYNVDINKLFSKVKKIFPNFTISVDDFEFSLYFISNGEKNIKVGDEIVIISYLEGLLMAYEQYDRRYRI